jgi:fructokinase
MPVLTAARTVASVSMRVTVVGEAVLDRVHAPDGTITDVPGGSPANVALALHRAGIHADLRARFSRDAAGRVLRDHLHSQGVDLTASVDTDDPALIVDAVIASSGSPTYTFHLEGAADFRWTHEELTTPLPDGTRILHTGSLAATMQPGCKVLQEWASIQQVPISYDVNVRPGAWRDDADRQATARVAQGWIEIASVIKASDEDIEHLAPGTTWKEWVQDHGAGRLIVITRGGEGAVVIRDRHIVAQVSPAPVTVVDTVGAGDTFMSWLLAALANDDAVASGDFAAVDDSVLEQAARVAVHAAAITCTRRGCDPPRRDEVALD